MCIIYTAQAHTQIQQQHTANTAGCVFSYEKISFKIFARVIIIVHIVTVDAAVVVVIAYALLSFSFLIIIIIITGHCIVLSALLPVHTSIHNHFLFHDYLRLSYFHLYTRTRIYNTFYVIH